MTVTLTNEQHRIVIWALEAYLTQTRHDIEDTLDVGGNADGLRSRRDLIKQTIDTVEKGDS